MRRCKYFACFPTYQPTCSLFFVFNCMHAVSSTHYLELYIAIRALITRHCLHYVTIETIEGMAAKTFGTLFRSKDQQEGSLWRGKGNEGVDGL